MEFVGTKTVLRNLPENILSEGLKEKRRKETVIKC